MNHSRHPINTLPDHVRVFSSLDQIKPMMVYAKPPNSEGRQMSKGYMAMFAQNRILPREPYFGVDGRKYVDVVIGDVSTIRTYRKGTTNLTSAFAKKLRQGLVLTPTQGIYETGGGRAKRTPMSAERVENLNRKGALATEIRTSNGGIGNEARMRVTRTVERVENLNRKRAVLAEIRTSKGSIGKEARMRVTRSKLNKVLTKKGEAYKASVAQAKKAEQDDFEMYKRDNTGFKSVYFRFKCEMPSVLDDEAPVILKYKYSAKLTSPVIRALVRFATSKTFDKLKYQFKKEDGTFDYKPITPPRNTVPPS